MKIKIVNFPISKNISENANEIIRILKSANKGELVIFPEGALSGYFPQNGFISIDYSYVEKALQEIQELSKTLEIFIVLGTLIGDGDNLFNSAIFLSPFGERKIYNKINLATLERGQIQSGGELPVFSIEENNSFGIQLCREIRFPEQWRVLAMNGAKFIVHINNAINDDGDDADVWRSHLISRAAELQRFVISVNVASDKQKCPTMVVDPNGHILEEVRSSELVVKNLELDLLSVSDWYLSQARSDVVSINYLK